MKTKELIDYLDNEGFLYTINDNRIEITNYFVIYTDSRKLHFYENSIYVGDLAIELLEKLMDYCKTPIADRNDEEEEYYFKAEYFGPKYRDEHFFNYNEALDTWWLGTNTYNNTHIKTKFTIREFDELYNRLCIDITFKEIEIKE